MIQIKKTILTLALLLTAVGGAWATETTVTWSSGDTYENNNSKDGVTLSGELVLHIDEWTLAYDEGKGTFTTELGNFTKIEITGGFINGFSGEGWSGRTWTGNAAAVPFNGYLTDEQGGNPWTITFTIEPASSGTTVDVAWDKDKKTGSFTMPGGNVTLEPEYYPQAELATGGAPTAINDVPATTDGAIVKAGTVKNIGETTTAQGTLMYYVSQSPLADAALLALAADQWTADVPTAKSLAEGQAYVYYYVRGNDSNTDAENFSDGDILADNALTVTIAAEPTYAVTFADDTAEPTLWTADPNAGVKKGQQVTVTYTGTKKVIGVKAEKKKKAAGPITVTWNNDDITGSGNSFTKDGVTITAGDIDFNDKNFGDGGTFTTTLGNFTKIEVTTDSWNASGTGWSLSGTGGTWTGNASSVSFSGDIDGHGAGNTKLVFTIEPTN